MVPGRSLLIHPVLEQGASQVQVYFPGNDEVWYDADTFQKYDRQGTATIPVDLYKVSTNIRKKLRAYLVSTGLTTTCELV